jgi:hypothetical protein
MLMSERDYNEVSHYRDATVQEADKTTYSDAYRILGNGCLVFGGSWAIIETTPPTTALFLIAGGLALRGVGKFAREHFDM